MALRGRVGSLKWIAIPIAATVALLLILIIGSLLGVALLGGKSYTIPDNAMAPAVVTGDWILALPLSRPVPERGAVVVFRHPNKPGIDYIKRIIAFAGETVQVRGGVVHIDGQAAAMERITDRVIPNLPQGRTLKYPHCKNKPVARGGDCLQEQWRETLPDGTTQIVLNIVGEIGGAPGASASSADNTTVFTVPEGHVFVLGDHRDNSIDSRFAPMGMIPVGNLRHVAWIVHSSFDKSKTPKRPRFERFFTRVE